MTDIIPNGKVHPAAQLFPSLSDEELNELSADIKTNGLMFPVVLDEKGTLIDGRMRKEACQRAEIEPKYIRLEGQDTVSFIISANLNRRNLTKAQRAILAAKIRCEFASSGSTKKSASSGSIRELEVKLGVSDTGIAKAVVILEHAPDLENAVMNGSKTLNAAYNEAQSRRVEANSDEALMLRLKKDAPDLAESVRDEKQSLASAIKELDEREENYRRRCKSVAEKIEGFLTFTGAISPTPIDVMVADIRQYIIPGFFSHYLREVTQEQMKKAAKIFNELAKGWPYA